MSYLLIDTNAWKRLIGDIEFNRSLLLIEKWLYGKDIFLLCPQILEVEWAKHREIKRDEISRKIKNRVREFNSITRINNDSFLVDDLSEKKLLEQIDLADSLMENALKVSVTKELRLQIYDKQLQGIAPFHDKQHSLKDAEIIFSTLEYLRKNSANELIFVTADKGFWNNKNTKNPALHPDIQNGYPDIKVLIFPTFKECKDYLIKEKGFEDIQHSAVIPYSGKVSIDSTLPASQQLDQFFKNFDGLSFIPIEYLITSLPFRGVTSPYSHYNSFHIDTKNEDLFNCIKDSLSGERIDADIANRFHRNLIYSISLKGKEELTIPQSRSIECDCAKCTFEKLQFFNAYRKEGDNEHENSIKQQMQVAYANCMMGKYSESIESFLYASKLNYNDRNDKHIHSIIYFNLLLLKKLVRDNSNEYQKLLSKVEKVEAKKVS